MGWGTQTVLVAETPTADEMRSTGRLRRERGPGQTFGAGNTEGAGGGAASALNGLECWGPTGGRVCGARGPARGQLGGAAQVGREGGPESRRGTQVITLRSGEKMKKKIVHAAVWRERKDIRMLADGGKGRNRAEIQCREERLFLGGGVTKPQEGSVQGETSEEGKSNIPRCTLCNSTAKSIPMFPPPPTSSPQGNSHQQRINTHLLVPSHATLHSSLWV